MQWEGRKEGSRSVGPNSETLGQARGHEPNTRHVQVGKLRHKGLVTPQAITSSVLTQIPEFLTV